MTLSSELALKLDLRLTRLENAISSRRSNATCLRYWSSFIRARDEYRCVICDSQDGVVAHHVCRRAFLIQAQFQTGNGATLCRDCHREAHIGFNGAPDFFQPMDAEGGEKLDAMAELYRALSRDFLAKWRSREDYYFLSDFVLETFKVFQGYDPDKPIVGTRIQQAWWIWDGPSAYVVAALVRANFPNQRT